MSKLIKEIVQYYSDGNTVKLKQVTIEITPLFEFWKILEAAANDFSDKGYFVDVKDIRIKRTAYIDYASTSKFIRYNNPIERIHEVKYHAKINR